MLKNAVQLEVSAASHTGRVRRVNQDAYGYSAEARCFAVCDGMGGAAGGEVASRIAMETFLERLGPQLPEDATPIPIARRIEQAVAAANRILYTRARREPALHGMGTTLVALVLSGPDADDEPAEVRSDGRDERIGRGGGWACIAHVGDSRCYLLRAGSLRRCTEDHSLVEEQVRLGQMTEQEAVASPMRHVITRAVGVRASVAVEVQLLATEPGDLFLLCSDGLTRELDEARIEALLRDLLEQPAYGAAGEARIAQALVEQALAAGGGDNITCLTVYLS